MSSRNGTPASKKKRPRPQNNAGRDSQSLPSVKKRRLNGEAVAAPVPGSSKPVRRVASPRRGFANKDRSSPEQPVESPDSGSGGRQHGALGTARKASSVYDVPDSEDELSKLPVTRREASRQEPEAEAGASGAKGKTSDRGPARPRQRGGKRGRPRKEGKDDTAGPDGALDSSRTPVEAQSGDKVNGTRVDGHDPSQDVGPVDQDASGEPTPTRTGSKTVLRDGLSGVRSRDSIPKLKGILTPRRREREGLRRKSVAFETTGNNGEAEVYFEDLPSKPGETPVRPSVKKVGRPRGGAKKQDIHPANVKDTEEDVGSGESEGDDEVCVICSRPESKAPNEIVFCDGCDKAVHQKCYGVATIPKGDWFCRECSQEDLMATPSGAGPAAKYLKGDKAFRVEAQIPDIPNFENHLQTMQRVLLDRCTGLRRIKLQGQDEAYDKAFQLVEQTIVAGEGNSMLIIGARGCGKTTLVESVLAEMTKIHRDEFHVVRLNGFIHTDDKLALKETWRQLGKEMDVEDELINKTSNYADTLASLLALLSHPSEIGEAQEGVTSRSVVFVIDEFDLFATHARQTLLYNLFDIAQARKAPIAVLGLTTRIDVVDCLEKRVKSRFSHRYVYLSLPKSPPAYWAVCRQGLSIDEEDMVAEGIDVRLKGHSQFWNWWNERIEALHETPSFRDHLEYHFYCNKSVSAFLTSCILPLAHLSSTSPSLAIPAATAAGREDGTSGRDGAVLTLDPPDSKLHLLASLSDLDLALLIAAARLDIVADTDTVNFAMAYDEYASLMGRQRAQSATSGALALGAAAARVWGRGVAGIAWEQLVALGLLVPAGGGAGGRAAGAAGLGGLEAKMWRVDVVLEEIPEAVKLNAVLARWCKEI